MRWFDFSNLQGGLSCWERFWGSSSGRPARRSALHLPHRTGRVREPPPHRLDARPQNSARRHVGEPRVCLDAARRRLGTRHRALPPVGPQEPQTRVPTARSCPQRPRLPLRLLVQLAAERRRPGRDLAVLRSAEVGRGGEAIRPDGDGPLVLARRFSAPPAAGLRPSRRPSGVAEGRRRVPQSRGQCRPVHFRARPGQSVRRPLRPGGPRHLDLSPRAAAADRRLLRHRAQYG